MPTKKTMMTLAAVIGTSVSAIAAPPTFTKDVLPIIQENCQTCHRSLGANLSGMIAPMSFMTYEEVRPWSKAISKAVANGDMPPWHAAKEFHGIFKNERHITDEERQILIDWAKTGAKRGNLSDAPEPRIFTDAGWQLSQTLGEPDLLLVMPDPYWVADDVQDIQPRIEIKLTKEQLPEMAWVRAIEYRPGSEVVHHIVGNVLKPGDENDLRARTNFGQIASGTDPQNYREGFGLPLYPESTISLSMHYHKEAGPGTGAWDQSEIAVWFHDKPVVHPLQSTTIAHGDFELPPNQKRWVVSGARTWDEDIIVLEFLPHMHLRGSSAKYTAIYPDGTKEVLLDVPEWDYNWQTGYEYAEYKTLPAGTRIEWELTYDNSAERAAEAGFDNNRTIRFGGPTTDEMDLGWLTWTYVEENKWPESRQSRS
ncbi:MAG: hypothetical protein VCD00_16605, partial [Candidatus Hydrogenedentota bacterium]